MARVIILSKEEQKVFSTPSVLSSTQQEKKGESNE